MKVGLMVPQGWKGEYDGWDPAAAWQRSLDLAAGAERLGFESLWLFDHFHTVPQPTDEITFESFTMLGALAHATSKVRLGHMVICTGFRNPALTSKMAATLDVISGGRFELGIGAGWKQDEWLAYGYGFPQTVERLEALGDHLEIIRRMLSPGVATYEGTYASVAGAYNNPKGLQAHIPIIVGGNGQKVTWRYAARFADELNLVFLGPDEVAASLPIIRERCEAEDRDPATLKVSIYVRDEDVREPGAARSEIIRRYAELGLSRLVAMVGRWSVEPEAQEAFAADVLAAGVALDPPAR